MKLLTRLLALLISQSVYAQRSEFGLQAGVCNYWGDLAPRVVFKETHATGGIFYRLNLNNTWALKLEANRYYVTASDKNFDFNKNRNLSFQSHINEAAMLLEFNFLKFGPYILDKKFTSYVYAGVAGFSFNPQAIMGGKTYDLRNFKTEGVAYNKFSMAIPFGIGIKYMPNNKFCLESQIGFRKTYTDYLDDVSKTYPDVQSQFTDGSKIGAMLTDRSTELYGAPQYSKGYKRGSPNNNDWYMSWTVSLSVRLFTKVKCARFF